MAQRVTAGAVMPSKSAPVFTRSVPGVPRPAAAPRRDSSTRHRARPRPRRSGKELLESRASLSITIGTRPEQHFAAKRGCGKITPYGCLG